MQTRDESSLWADASSGLSGGADDDADDDAQTAFEDSDGCEGGGLALASLDRLEPERARDFHGTGAGAAFHTALKSGTDQGATSSIDIEVGSVGEVKVFAPKISGRPRKDPGGGRGGDPFMDRSPSNSSGGSGRVCRTVAKLIPTGSCSWCCRIPCPQKVKPVHALFLLIPIVIVMLYLCYVYFVQPNV